VYNIKTGEKVQILKGHKSRVVGVCKSVNKDGMIYSCSLDGIYNFVRIIFDSIENKG
jgi:hypothetical protein